MASGWASASCWMAACRALREAASLGWEGSGEQHGDLSRHRTADAKHCSSWGRNRGPYIPVMEMKETKPPHPRKSTG